MRTRRASRGQALADEFNRLQKAFEERNPEIAEALKVMNMSLTQYIAALGYMRLPGFTGGASDHCAPIA